ncbi:hypothetical protein BpHYR1_041735 [Brachionus plicatilis]|uniref:Uncharacterized protein n=1 Tax=Brachionus plicatilis TaxID=10195 RepID=A0A3M7S7Y2_BRAPC|nr:hypothetical protein BpHYR1_041735 [Brachionus plicatilis]
MDISSNILLIIRKFKEIYIININFELVMSRAISTNKEEIQRWNFKNSLKLNLKKLEKPVNHQVIFELLDQVLSQFQKNQITSIYNFASNKFWIIEFNSTLKLDHLFECPVKLNDQEFKLEDANKVIDPRKYCTFRIHFLPTNFNTQLLHNFYNVLKIDGLKIEEISEEKYKDSTIKNGVKRATSSRNTIKNNNNNDDKTNCFHSVLYLKFDSVYTDPISSIN